MPLTIRYLSQREASSCLPKTFGIAFFTIVVFVHFALSVWILYGPFESWAMDYLMSGGLRADPGLTNRIYLLEWPISYCLGLDRLVEYPGFLLLVFSFGNALIWAGVPVLVAVAGHRMFRFITSCQRAQVTSWAD